MGGNTRQKAAHHLFFRQERDLQVVLVAKEGESGAAATTHKRRTAGAFVCGVSFPGTHLLMAVVRNARKCCQGSNSERQNQEQYLHPGKSNKIFGKLRLTTSASSAFGKLRLTSDNEDVVSHYKEDRKDFLSFPYYLTCQPPIKWKMNSAS